MKRKNMMAVLACTVCLAVSSAALAGCGAEETTETAATEESDSQEEETTEEETSEAEEEEEETAEEAAEAEEEEAAEDTESSEEDETASEDEAEGPDEDAEISDEDETASEDEAEDSDEDVEVSDEEETASDDNAADSDEEETVSDADATASDADATASDADATASDADATASDADAESLTYPDYTALDYVELGQYKGLTVTRPAVEITEEEVEETILSYIESAELYDTITEGTVQDGDIANIDYEGKLDGEAFDGGTAEGYDLEIGSGTFIDGFEDGLIGVEIGDTVDLDLTFPEDYSSEDLAGQDVVFTVTVNEVSRLQEVTDETIETLTDGEYTDVESYRDYLYVALAEAEEASNESTTKSELLTQVEENSEVIEFPPEVLDYGVSYMRAYYEEYAAYYSMEFEDFISGYFGITEEEFTEQAEASVKEGYLSEVILRAIFESEEMEISDEEYESYGLKYAEYYGYDTVEELAQVYGEDIIRLSIMQEKSLDFLLDNAVIVDEAEATASDADATMDDADE
ncbi:MAG: trigger factor [Clostridiales bacterium]|nr:trigger factor [Clostridiales bacterium]